MHEPIIDAASVTASVTAVSAQKTGAPTDAFRIRYPIIHAVHVTAPPSALPCSGRGENAPAIRHASTQHMSAISRVSTSGSSSRFTANAASQLSINVSTTPAKPQAAARESNGSHFCSVCKKTPPAEHMSQHIPAGGESFRKPLYTSGPFGSSCFGSSFFASFAFCLAALRS